MGVRFRTFGPTGKQVSTIGQAIPKTGRAEHAVENAGAADIELSEDELRRIDEAFPRGRRRRGVPAL
jgi:diketogulonate reductase-like aldo/keto reductase